LGFPAAEDRGVQVYLDRDRAFRGYTNMLDGRFSVTAERIVRFGRSGRIGRAVALQTWIEQSLSAFHVMTAKLVRGTQARANVSGRFMEQGEVAGAGLG
jgi:hypothetical protein